ncbi:hypothetical protein [Mesorhizobium sp. CN2-181]|uniref:hypothetical protein n=1 Tax=Mesorhizobium yinganensis TaxID=3157707 RepID=UPI0032B7EEAD
MVKPRENRIPIMFSDVELDQIDEWRHDNRIATRADAVRRLCKIALTVDREFETIVDNSVNLHGAAAVEHTESVKALHNLAIGEPGKPSAEDVIQYHADVTHDMFDRAFILHVELVGMFNQIAYYARPGRHKLADRLVAEETKEVVKIIDAYNEGLDRINAKAGDPKSDKAIWLREHLDRMLKFTAKILERERIAQEEQATEHGTVDGEHE